VRCVSAVIEAPLQLFGRLGGQRPKYLRDSASV
jgi:hypothetical protein